VLARPASEDPHYPSTRPRPKASLCAAQAA